MKEPIVKQSAIKDIDDMVSFLSNYRTAYYRWIALDAQVGLHSPVISDEAKGTNRRDVGERWALILHDLDVCERRMQEVKAFIEPLDEIDPQAYLIIVEKFIYFKTLEEIALMTHYSIDHMKHDLYPRAKRKLYAMHYHTESHLK